jgi:hypothetical protein
MALINRVIINDPPGDFLFGFKADGTDRTASRERTKDGDNQDFVVDKMYEVFAWQVGNLSVPYAQKIFRFNPDRLGELLLGGTQNKIINTLTINYTANPPGGPAFLFGFNQDGSDKSISRLRSGDGNNAPLRSGKPYDVFVFQAGSDEIYDHDTFIFQADDTGNGTFSGLDFSGHLLTADGLALNAPPTLDNIENLLGWQNNGQIGKMATDSLYRLGLGGKRITYTQGNPGQFPYRKILTLPADTLAAYDGCIVRIYGGGWGAEQKTLMELTAGNRGGFSASYTALGAGGFISVVAQKLDNEVALYLHFQSAFGTAVVTVDGIGCVLDDDFTGLDELPDAGVTVYDTAVNPPLFRVANSGNAMSVKLTVAELITGKMLSATNPEWATEVFRVTQWNHLTKRYENVSLGQLKAALDEVEAGDPDPNQPGSVDPGSVDPDPEELFSVTVPFADMCSGNATEVRSKVVTIPAGHGGNYNLVLTYRSHEKAVNGFVLINTVAQPVGFAQVASFTAKTIGMVALNEGDNIIAISSGSAGGYLCFNSISIDEQDGTVDPGTVDPVDQNGVLVTDFYHGTTNNYKIQTRLTLDASGWPEHMQDCSVGAGDRTIGNANLQQCLVMAGYDGTVSSQNPSIGFDRYAASLKRMRELGHLTGTIKLLAEAKVISGTGQGVIIRYNLKKNGALTAITAANGVDFAITGTDNGGADSGVYALTSAWKSLAWLVIDLDADTVTLQNYTGGTVGTVDPGTVGTDPGDDEDVDMPTDDFEGTDVVTSARVHLDTIDRLAPRPQGNHYDFAPQNAKFTVNTNRFPEFVANAKFARVYDLPYFETFAEYDLRKFGMKLFLAKPALRTAGYFTTANLPKANRVAFYGDSWFYNNANDFADDYKTDNSVDDTDPVVVRLHALSTHRMVIDQTTIDYLAAKVWSDILSQAGQTNGCEYVCFDIETDFQASVESHTAGHDEFANQDCYRMMGMLWKKVGALSLAAGKLCKPFSYGIELVVLDAGEDQLKLANYFTSGNPSDPYGSSTHPILQALATYGGYIGNDKYPRETWPANSSWYDKSGGSYVTAGGFRRTRTTDLTGTLYNQTYSFKGIDTTSASDYPSYNQKEADHCLVFPYADIRIIQGYLKAFNNNVVPRKFSDRISMFANAHQCRWIREVSEPIYSPGHAFGERPLNPDQATLIEMYRATFVGEWKWSSQNTVFAQGANGGGGVSAMGAIEYMIYAEQRAANLLNKFWAAHADYYYIFPIEGKTGYRTANPNVTVAQQFPFMWGIGEGRDVLMGFCYYAQDTDEERTATWWYNDGTRQSPGYKVKMKGRQTAFELTKLPTTITNFDPKFLFIQWTDINGTLRTVSGDWHYPVTGNPTPPALINGTGYEVDGGTVDPGSVGTVSGSVGSVSGGTVDPDPDVELTRGYITNHNTPGTTTEFNQYLEMVDVGMTNGLNCARVSVRVGEWIKKNGDTAKWDAQANLAKKGTRNHPIFLHIILGFDEGEFTNWIDASKCQRFMDGSQSATRFPHLEYWRNWATGSGYDQTNPVFYMEPVVRAIISHFGPTEVTFGLSESGEFAYSHKNGGPKGIIDFSDYSPLAHQGLATFSGNQYTALPAQPTWGAVGEYIFDTYGNDGVGKWSVGYRTNCLATVKNWGLYILQGTGARLGTDVGGCTNAQSLVVGTGNFPALMGGVKIGKVNSMPKDDWRMPLDFLAQVPGILIDQEQDFSLFNAGGNFWQYGYGNLEPVPRVVTDPNLVGVFTNARRHLLRGGRGVSLFGPGYNMRSELYAHIQNMADLLNQPVAARTGASGTVTATLANLRKGGVLFNESAWIAAGGREHPVNFTYVNETLLLP